MGGLHLVFSDQRLNYTGFCVFEDLLVQADLLLMQEEDLLLLQEEDLLLVQEEDLLLVPEEDQVMPPRCTFFSFCKCTCYGLIGILVQAQVMILWGFLDALTKFLSTVRVWIGSIVGTLIFEINIFTNGRFGMPPDCIDDNGRLEFCKKR